MKPIIMPMSIIMHMSIYMLRFVYDLKSIIVFMLKYMVKYVHDAHMFVECSAQHDASQVSPRSIAASPSTANQREAGQRTSSLELGLAIDPAISRSPRSPLLAAMASSSAFTKEAFDARIEQSKKEAANDAKLLRSLLKKGKVVELLKGTEEFKKLDKLGQNKAIYDLEQLVDKMGDPLTEDEATRLLLEHHGPSLAKQAEDLEAQVRALDEARAKAEKGDVASDFAAATSIGVDAPVKSTTEDPMLLENINFLRVPANPDDYPSHDRTSSGILSTLEVDKKSFEDTKLKKAIGRDENEYHNETLKTIELQKALDLEVNLERPVPLRFAVDPEKLTMQQLRTVVKNLKGLFETTHSRALANGIRMNEDKANEELDFVQLVEDFGPEKKVETKAKDYIAENSTVNFSRARLAGCSTKGELADVVFEGWHASTKYEYEKMADNISKVLQLPTISPEDDESTLSKGRVVVVMNRRELNDFMLEDDYEMKFRPSTTTGSTDTWRSNYLHLNVQSAIISTCSYLGRTGFFRSKTGTDQPLSICLVAWQPDYKLNDWIEDAEVGVEGHHTKSWFVNHQASYQLNHLERKSMAIVELEHFDLEAIRRDEWEATSIDHARLFGHFYDLGRFGLHHNDFDQMAKFETAQIVTFTSIAFLDPSNRKLLKQFVDRIKAFNDAQERVDEGKKLNDSVIEKVIENEFAHVKAETSSSSSRSKSPSPTTANKATTATKDHFAKAVEQGKLDKDDDTEHGDIAKAFK